MPNLNITYGEMNDSATKLRTNKEEIDARLEQCKTIVSGLVGSGFVTDQASGRFDEVHTEFVNAANKTMETLAQLSEWLDKAVEALRNMDAEMAKSLSSNG